MRHFLVVTFLCITLPSIAHVTDGTEIGTWQIVNGKIQASNESDSLARRYWNFLYDLLPNEPMNKYVVSLRLFTDGKDDALGGMRPLDRTNSRWQINLDTADVNPWTNDSIRRLDCLHTIVHEFGHVLTLNSSQIVITNDQFQDDSKGYLTSEGYAKKESYLNGFVDWFWGNDMLGLWDGIDAMRNERRKALYLQDFYYMYQDRFTTSYAAESPEEDLAESWTFFVLDDKPREQRIKHRKVRFFYQFPELVAYRQAIREKMGLLPVNYLKNYEAIKAKLVLAE